MVLPRPRAALFALLLFPDLLLGVVIEDSEELEEAVLQDTKGVASKRGLEPGARTIALEFGPAERVARTFDTRTHAHIDTCTMREDASEDIR